MGLNFQLGLLFLALIKLCINITGLIKKYAYDFAKTKLRLNLRESQLLPSQNTVLFLYFLSWNMRRRFHINRDNTLSNKESS